MTINELLETRLDGIRMPKAMSVRIEQTGTEKDDPRYKLNVIFDYTGWTVRQVLDSLANSSVAITYAGMLRKQTPEYVKGCNGKVILVSDAGKSPRDAVDVNAEYKAAFRVASPEEKAKMLAELQAMVEQG